MKDFDDILGGGGRTSAKFEKPGDTYVGQIIHKEARQQTSFTTGELLYFDNGEPRMQLVIAIQTQLRDPAIEDDDGVRAVYVKGKDSTNNLRNAIKMASAKRLEEGGWLKTWCSTLKPNPKGLPSKILDFQYAPPTDNGEVELPSDQVQAKPIEQSSRPPTPGESAVLARLRAQQPPPFLANRGISTTGNPVDKITDAPF